MNHSTKLNTFFVEMLLVLLLFSVCAAVTLLFFGRSHQMAEQSCEKSRAVLCVQNAEQDFLTGGEQAVLREAAQKQQKENGVSCELWYDKDWRLSQKENAYRLVFKTEHTTRTAGEYVTVTMHVLAGPSKETVYSVTTGKYFPKEREAAQ
jgi:type II secretory pathway pseudopilin PulG